MRVWHLDSKKLEEHDFDFDILDLTKVCLEELVPLGTLESSNSIATLVSISLRRSRLLPQLASLYLASVSPTILSYREETYPTLIFSFLDSASTGRSFLSIAPSVQL